MASAPNVTPPRIGTDPQRASNSLVTSVNNAIQSIYNANPVVGGTHITGVVLKTSTDASGNVTPVDTAVVHSLGRPAKGFNVSDCSALGVSVIRSTDTGSAPNTQLLLTHNATTAGVTVDVVVF